METPLSIHINDGEAIITIGSTFQNVKVDLSSCVDICMCAYVLK